MSDLFIDVEQLILDYGELKISKKQLMKHLSALDYQKLRSKIKAMQEYRSFKIGDRDMEVLYITGQSGSGKTVFAKYLADKLHFDYFVSGSGDDFLDGYDKEECIILDDFRASSMRFAEMLKMTDNNTNSTVRSRYYNKDISNCHLMVMTSVYEPCDLYSMFKSDDGDTPMKEPIMQFYRRLGNHFFKIASNGDIEEFATDKNDMFKYIKTGANLGNINEVFDELNIVPGGVRTTSLIGNLLKK